ncbi:DUF1016 family protein [bacterium]|nr:DUF1016 family protein [bacterium]MBU1635936.1 DUF1016 family protein [bacterium]MBU1874093.1 DUF1016 family protein [bacterium]
MNNVIIPGNQYREWLIDLKLKVRRAQLKAAVSVNTALLEFYWDLGADIVNKQKDYGWGAGFLKQLSRDLMSDFPDMKGFSKRNLEQIRRWYLFYTGGSGHHENSDSVIAKQPATQLFQIPWWHNVIIVSRSKTVSEALFYVQETIENGWSRAILEAQIETGLFERQGSVQSNFPNTLPAPQSELARQILKDPYSFEFITLRKDAKERDLQQGLLNHLKDFMIELGTGFAFAGSNYHLEVGGDDFYLDLLFYHLKLHCYIVIELKMDEFKPEYAGKMNFYLTAVDNLLRQAPDNPSIGILLCKGKNRIVVEYALKDVRKPIGVSEYKYTRALPKDIRSELPSIEEIEAELVNE